MREVWRFVMRVGPQAQEQEQWQHAASGRQINTLANSWLTTKVYAHKAPIHTCKLRYPLCRGLCWPVPEAHGRRTSWRERSLLSPKSAAICLLLVRSTCMPLSTVYRLLTPVDRPFEGRSEGRRVKTGDRLMRCCPGWYSRYFNGHSHKQAAAEGAHLVKGPPIWRVHAKGDVRALAVDKLDQNNSELGIHWPFHLVPVACQLHIHLAIAIVRPRVEPLQLQACMSSGRPLGKSSLPVLW